MRRENSSVTEREPRGELARATRRALYQAIPAPWINHGIRPYSRVVDARASWHLHMGFALNVPYRPGVSITGIAVQSLSYVFNLVWQPNGVLDLTRRRRAVRPIQAWRRP